MKSRFLKILVFLGISISGWAQVPQIGNVERLTAYPSTSLLITGSGFSDNPAQLQVWFGNVKGIITESTGSAIRVTVPAQARLSSLEVINLTSKRSAKSKNLFTPNFSGVQPFSPTFRRRQFNSTEGVFDLCTCDLDNDGDTDIVGSKITNSLMLLTNTSTVYADSTVANFTTSSITIGFPTWSLTCGDLNDDGKPEIVATRGGSNATQIFIFPNNTTVANTIVFGSVVTLDLVSGDQAKEVAIHDLNKDGRSEIIVTNASLSNNKIYIFENLLSSGSIVANEFNRISKSVNTATSTLALEVQDYNGDGWSDIAVIQGNNSVNAYIVPNPANGTVNFTATFQTVGVSGSNLSDLASADFDKDGKIDFVASDRQSGGGRAFVMLNRSTPTTFIFSAVSGTFSTAVAHGVDVADMNGDGFPDFVVASRELAGSPQVDVYINNGLSTVGFDKYTYTPPYDAWFVKTGDYDGDSKPDIAITVTDNVNFGIHVLRNRNCHKPVILNDDPTSICDGQTITLNAVNLKGVTFSWERNGVPVGTGPTLNITNAVAAGTYVVKATGENASPQKCISIPSASLTVTSGVGTAPATPAITQPNGVCVGTSLTLQTTNVAGATYLWSGPNSYSASTNSPSALVTGSATTTEKGNYFLRVKVGACTSNASAAKFVDVIAPAAFSISSNAGVAGVCAGQPVTLSVNPDASYGYQWKRNGTNLSGQTGSSYAIASATGADEANYTVLVSHQTITCSSETNQFSLAVFNAPVSSFTISPAQVCVGTQVTFNSSGSTVDNTATINYAWAFGDAGVGTGASPTHIYVNASASVNAALTINYSGVNGCSSVSNLAFPVSTATVPSIVVDPIVTEICPDGSETVTLTVPEIFTSYIWSTSEAGPTISVKEPGTYTVETINSGGCEGTAQIILSSKSGCEDVEVTILAPKAFTPNGDGFNDFWKINGIETSDPDCELNFFDGRGKRVLVMKASAFPVEGWDGKSGGTELPDGTYYYVFGCPNGKPATGSVLIMR